MARAPAIPKEKWYQVITRYKSGLSMQQVADFHGVHIDVITYILRKTKTPRRSFTEANAIVFRAKKPSFTIRKRNSDHAGRMNLMGAMLYWAEGYKRDTATGIDFANSDPDMAQLFLNFLRSRYVLDPERLYCQIYYYADQDLNAITSFWAKKLSLPYATFRSPYKKLDFRSEARKLPYGVIHIRYGDKKLLWDVLNLIKSCKVKYCVGG